mgnify:CR=1 FL=1
MFSEEYAVIGAILVSSDEFNNRVSIVEELRSLGYRLIEAETGIRVLELARRYKNMSLAFIDTALLDIDSLSLVKQLRIISPQMPIVLLYDEASLNNIKLESVKDALSAGADYLLPYNSNKLQIKSITTILINYKLLEHNIYYKSCISNLATEFKDFVCHSEDMQTCIRQAQIAAAKGEHVFIGGENGTGRRQIAQAIHHADKERNQFPFVTFYCDVEALEKDNNEAWQKQLNEHIKKADNGTLCLINLDALSKIQLRYIAEILRGMQCRIICSVTSNPKRWKKNSELSDIYSSLSPSYIIVPPLRKRREDIEEISQRIVWQFVVQMGVQQKISGLTGAANALLAQYDWPGNLSELEKMLYQALIITNGPLLKVKDFPKINGDFNESSAFESLNNIDAILFKEDGHIKTLETIESEAIQKAVEYYKGSLSEVARRLKIGRSTLYRKLYKN